MKEKHFLIIDVIEDDHKAGKKKKIDVGERERENILSLSHNELIIILFVLPSWLLLYMCTTEGNIRKTPEEINIDARMQVGHMRGTRRKRVCPTQGKISKLRQEAITLVL